MNLAFDTNVLVRAALRDDPEQAPLPERLNSVTPYSKPRGGV